MKNILALLSGADLKLLNYTETGRTAWTSVGLNILLAGALTGTAAALTIELFLPRTHYLLWLSTGVSTMFLVLVGLRLAVKHTIPHLHYSINVFVLVLCLVIAGLGISIPFEIKILLIANPGGALVTSDLMHEQTLEWLKASNGVHALMLLRIAIRLSSFIILSLPFFVAWNARRGTYFKVKNAHREVYSLLYSIK